MATWVTSPNGVKDTTSFTPAIRASMNALAWSVPISAPSSISTYSGYHALIANGGGGVWILNGQICLFRHEDEALICASNTVTGTNGSFAVDMTARTLTLSGFTTGNGTYTWLVGATGTLFATGGVGVGIYSDGSSYDWNGTVGNVTYTDASPTASGTAAVAGITSSGAGIPGTYATGTAATAGVTSSGAASSPGTASGTAAVGGATSSGAAASPAIATGTASVGGVTSTGSAGQSLFGTIGQSSAGQRADQTGASTGTLTTGYIARTPSAAVAINAQLAFNNRRWIVHTAGTLGAGSGPTGTGQQSDGTASLVAMTSTDTALTMTTQTSNSVMLAVLMRENWTSDTSAPTDNKGNTYTLVNGPNAYAGFPSARTALYAKTNAAGGSGHTVSATWPAKSATGAELSLLAVEVPTGRSTAIVQDASFVERTSSSSVTSLSVTTTGPAMLVAFWLGTGNVISVGTTHPGSPQTPFTSIPNADTAVAIHNNGYIQGKSAYAYVTAPGTYTATWTGTSEGAQLYLVAIQEAPGTAASGGTSVGGITSSGAAGPGATGTSAVAGVSSSGATSATAAGASGSAAVGGASSSGVAGIAAFGTAAVGGVSSTGATAPGTYAAGAGAVGGITATGQTTTGTFASGAASVGGIASSGLALLPGAASGVASVGGIASAGLALLAGASGTASVGGIAATGTAAVTASGAPADTFESLVAAMDDVIMDLLG